MRRINRDMFKKVYWSPCEVPIILVRFIETGILFTAFRKILTIEFHENSSELFHADRWTDRHFEINSRSSQFFRTRLTTAFSLL